MKGILRSYLITLFALYLTPQIIKGFTIEGGLLTLFFGGAVMTVINWFLKPIIKFLLIPFNILSLGLLSWIVNVLMLYLLTRLVPQISIKSWFFEGISFQGMNISGANLNIIMSFIFSSFILTFIINSLHWLFKK